MEDKYPNLPGILSEFKDGGLVLRNDPNPPATESILILGTAIDGPILEPVAVDASTAEAVFGKGANADGTSNGSTLIQGFEEAYQTGCRDIRLMRISGKAATSAIKASSTTFLKDRTQRDLLGPAPGNSETVFKLNKNVIQPESVSVKAAGIALPTDSFTVTNGTEEVPEVLESGTIGEADYVAPQAAIPAKNATVTLKPGVTSAGVAVYVTYSYSNADGSIVTVTENSFTNELGKPDYYQANGIDTTVDLTYVPKTKSVKLYANGVEVAGSAFSVNYTAQQLILHPGFIKNGQTLEATYTRVESIVEEPEIKLESVYGGYLYNDLEVEVKDITNVAGEAVGKLVRITKPDVKKAQITEKPLEFSSLDYPTFQLMVQAINSHGENNVVKASCANRYADIATADLQPQDIVNFLNGDDGVNLSRQEMYEALGGTTDAEGYIVELGAYQLLENYSVDMVVPVGVFFDDELAGKYDNFGYQLALATAVMSHRNTATMGIIATRPPEETGLRAIAEHADHLNSLDVDLFMRDTEGNIILDSNQEKIDLGRYISILAGPDVVVAGTRTGFYSTNSPAVYAGMISQMEVQSAPTNKQVPGIQTLRYTFSNSQLNELTGNRFVTYKTKQNGSIVAVTDAMTAAQATSDYTRLVTYRVAKRAVNEVRDVADPYIGEPNETPQRNAMSSAIDKRLGAMKEAGALQDYTFTVIATPEQQLLGQATIELTIVPPLELRQITVVVSLSTSL